MIIEVHMKAVQQQLQCQQLVQLLHQFEENYHLLDFLFPHHTLKNASWVLGIEGRRNHPAANINNKNKKIDYNINAINMNTSSMGHYSYVLNIQNIINSKSQSFPSH